MWVNAKTTTQCSEAEVATNNNLEKKRRNGDNSLMHIPTHVVQNCGRNEVKVSCSQACPNARYDVNTEELQLFHNKKKRGHRIDTTGARAQSQA
jgi:hypothetical protein